MQNTVPAGAQSNNVSDEAATESRGTPEQPFSRQHLQQSHNNNDPNRTPTLGFVDFDGTVKTVRARSIQRIMCGRSCLTFAFHSSALLLLIVVGLVMMILRGSASPDFGLWSGMLSLGVGGFLPQPKLKADTE